MTLDVRGHQENGAPPSDNTGFQQARGGPDQHSRRNCHIGKFERRAGADGGPDASPHPKPYQGDRGKPDGPHDKDRDAGHRRRPRHTAERGQHCEWDEELQGCAEPEPIPDMRSVSPEYDRQETCRNREDRRLPQMVEPSGGIWQHRQRVRPTWREDGGNLPCGIERVRARTRGWNRSLQPVRTGRCGVGLPPAGWQSLPARPDQDRGQRQVNRERRE